VNIGAPELLVLLLIPLIVVLWVVARRQSGSGASMKTHTAYVSDPTPEAYIQRAALALAGLPKHTLNGVGGTTLVLARRYTAAWRVVIAILLFPIGLIALIGHDEETATVAAATTDDQRTQVTLRGAFSGSAIDRLNTTLN
jgi:hypothetical protein